MKVPVPALPVTGRQHPVPVYQFFFCIVTLSHTPPMEAISSQAETHCSSMVYSYHRQETKPEKNHESHHWILCGGEVFENRLQTISSTEMQQDKKKSQKYLFY